MNDELVASSPMAVTGLPRARRGNLAQAVVQQLLARVEAGKYAPGQRLPSQEELCQEFEVSRTVVREAVASLRQSGHLRVRQGAGVFVAEALPAALDFGVFAARDVNTALQVLELRIGVEVEQVGLAAERRSPQTLAGIIAAFDQFNQLDGSDPEALAQADYDFHLAIALATNNPQFVQFAQALGRDIFLDLKLKHANASQHVQQGAQQQRVDSVGGEHAAILSAISIGDAQAARRAMRAHLKEGLDRYRQAVYGQM